MTKQDIFNKIAEITADVCSVNVDDIMNSCRKEDVVIARGLLVFWTMAAGFSVESLLTCAELNNANSVNSVKAKQEDFWVNKFAYHMLAKEIGVRLLEYAHSIGEDFDMWMPLNHMSRITGKY